MWFLITVILLFISKKRNNRKFTIFPSSVPQVQKKCRKNIQNENTKYICDLFPFVIFKREILTCMFTEQRSPFLIPIGEMDFFFFFFLLLLLLFCAVLLITVLFLFQKAAINNTLISKSDYVILCCEINKCIINVIIVKPWLFLWL